MRSVRQEITKALTPLWGQPFGYTFLKGIFDGFTLDFSSGLDVYCAPPRFFKFFFIYYKKQHKESLENADPLLWGSAIWLYLFKRYKRKS